MWEKESFKVSPFLTFLSVLTMLEHPIYETKLSCSLVIYIQNKILDDDTPVQQ